MTIDRKTLIIALVCVAIGWWTAGTAEEKPEPLENRPILRWIAKTARTLLWVSLFVEPPPAPEPPQHLAHKDDGTQRINHRQGW